MVIPRMVYMKKWRYEKIRSGSEMCDMLHNLVEKMAKHSRSLDERPPTKARAKCAPATREYR
jgi:hypothetical protein